MKLKRSVIAAAVTGLLSFGALVAIVKVPIADARPTPVPTSGGGGGPAGIANQAIAPSSVTLGDPPQPGYRQTIRATGVGDGGLYIDVQSNENAIAIVGSAKLAIGSGPGVQLQAGGSNLNINASQISLSGVFTAGPAGASIGPQSVPGTCGVTVTQGTIAMIASTAGAVTQPCVCATDGTNFEWINLLNPSVRTGTATSCPTSGTL